MALYWSSIEQTTIIICDGCNKQVQSSSMSCLSYSRITLNATKIPELNIKGDTGQSEACLKKDLCSACRTQLQDIFRAFRGESK